MNLDQLAAKVDKLAVAWKGELRNEMETVAQDGHAMVQTRLTETGKDVEGRPFKKYTRRYEIYKRGAVGTARKESAKRRAARRTKVATAEKPVGRYKGFVDFQLTTRMWQNMGIVSIKTPNDNLVVVRTGGRTAETRAKLEGNNKHRPGFYRLNETEKKDLTEQSRSRVTKFAIDFMKR